MNTLLVIQMTHDCVHEEQIQEQTRKLTELEAHVDYKDKRIDELIKDQKRMEDKLDTIGDNLNQLMLKSVQDDNNIDKRVTSLETTVKVLKWVVMLLFGSGVLWLILGFIK